MQDNFGYIIGYSAEGAGCKAKCDVLFGDVAKARCRLIPCGWDCGKSKNKSKDCCKKIISCRNKVDSDRASCKAKCITAPSYEPDIPEPPPDKDDAPEKDDTPTKDGVKSKFFDEKTKRALLYAGLAVGGIAGISLLIWGINAAVSKKITIK